MIFPTEIIPTVSFSEPQVLSKIRVKIVQGFIALTV